MSKEDNIDNEVKIDIENSTLRHHSKWTDQHERILAEWADKAMCYRWMHAKSENKYSYLSKLFTIPVIVLSTLTGSANFAIERVPENYQSSVQVGIGSLNILAGIITTVQQFLKINELNGAGARYDISSDFPCLGAMLTITLFLFPSAISSNNLANLA